MLTGTRAFLATAAAAALLGLAACGPTIQANDPYPQTTLISAPAKQSLEARVSAFDRDMNSRRMGALIDYVPPRLLQNIAEETGMSVEMMRAAGGSILQGVMSGIDIRGRHDLGKAVVGTAGNGEPFAIIPSALSLSVGSVSETMQGLTLALRDNGQWYLVDLADQDAIDEIRAAYPEFRGVALPVR